MNSMVVMAFLMISTLGFADTYNFYFQKGKSPKTVVQGKDGQSVIMEDEEEEEAVNEQKSIEVEDLSEEPEEEEEPRIVTQRSIRPSEELEPDKYLLLGTSFSSDFIDDSEHFDIGFGYRFNPYIAIESVASYCRQSDSERGPLGEFDVSSYCNYLTPEDRWMARVSLSVTPIRTELFGHRFMEMSFLMGFHTEYDKDGFRVPQPWNFGSTNIYPGDRIYVDKFWASHLGFALNFFINETVSLGAYARASQTGDHSQSGINLGFRW